MRGLEQLTLVAAEELDGVHEPRVERGGPPHPRRPDAPLRAAGQRCPAGGRALERASLRRLRAASVGAHRRRPEPQAQARGIGAGARVCKEPYFAASFRVSPRGWFRRLQWLRRCRGWAGGSRRRAGRRAYPEGETRQVPLQHCNVEPDYSSMIKRDTAKPGTPLPPRSQVTTVGYILGLRESHGSRRS